MFKPTLVDGLVTRDPQINDAKVVIAVGDSWFSMGSNPPWSTSNLFANMQFANSTTILHFGRPGQDVADMSNPKDNPLFVGNLTLRGATAWDAILVSGGGDDMIDFAAMPATLPDGTVRPQSQRLFLTSSEWNQNDATPNRYISPTGTAALFNNLQTYYANLVALRDGSTNPEATIFTHTYDYATPRNAGVPLVAPHGWIYPILLNYFIPTKDWDNVAKILINQIKQAQTYVAQGSHNFIVVDTIGTLIPAADGATGDNNDWYNEIHPNAGGYAKLGQVWNGKFAAAGL